MSHKTTMDELVNSLGKGQVFIVIYILQCLKTLCTIEPNTFFTVEEFYKEINIHPIETMATTPFTSTHLREIIKILLFFNIVEEKDEKIAYKTILNKSSLIKYHKEYTRHLFKNM